MAASSSAVHLPLLETEYHEGCPGCLLERRKISAKGGAPKKELTFIAFMVLCNVLPLSALYPFIYFMVRDFGIAESDTHIGTYAGYIGSALMFGRFLTSTLWGMWADRYGRKPVMVFGTATIVVFNTLFGFSTNFWLALTSRFLLGVTNGMLGPVRAYASEICSQEHQALGQSMVGTMWGVGLIVGPAIGGYFAQPSEKYPLLFPSGSLFDRFPYALPCLCISAISVVGLTLSFWLPESLHSHKGVQNTSDGKPEEHSVSKINHDKVRETKDYTVAVTKGDAQPVKKPVWKNWGMVASISLYCVWGLHDMAYSEIFSLWAVSPKAYGGLGFTTSEVGIVLAVSGAALLAFQLLAFAPLANRFGAIQMFRVSTASIITANFLLINNSVVINQRGFANGVSMSFVSLFRAIGPACAGALFSWSQGRLTSSFLPGMWMVFGVLNFIALITLIGTFEPILPKSLLNPVSEKP